MSDAKENYGWGLVGPGRFARMFCEELREVPRARLAAVASRSLEKSQSFADEFGFAAAYGTYDELFADPAVDIVYVVVPHAFHLPIAEAAMAAGKAGGCEKPLTPSAVDSKRLVACARKHGVFLMEALKTGFLPAVQKAKAWIEAGEIGDVTLLKADFCFMGSGDPKDRLLNPDLAGGATLDVGIYPLSLARLLLGEFDEIAAAGCLASTGVDETVSISTRHKGGGVGALSCSIRSSHQLDASVSGTKGKVLLPHAHRATEVTLVRDDGEDETFRSPDESRVKAEIIAAMEAMGQGEIECRGHRHSDTLALAEAMDEVMRQVKGATFAPSSS